MLYFVTRAICWFILAVLRRWKVDGRENIPRYGGLVVVANHTSYWDPVAVGCAIDRKMFFMAKSELFRIFLLGAFFSRTGAFPVYRGKADRVAIRTALRYLTDGQVVGVFPEGTRSHTGEQLNPQLGAVMLASKAQVPLLPVAVKGARGLFKQVKVKIGSPMYLPYHSMSGLPKKEMVIVGRQVMERISSLLAEV